MNALVDLFVDIKIYGMSIEVKHKHSNFHKQYLVTLKSLSKSLVIQLI